MENDVIYSEDATYEEAIPPTRPASLRAFGVAVRRRREGLGLTQDLLAIKTGISKPYLSNIETGRTPGPPSEGKLRPLARALGWDASLLLAAADWLRTPQSVRDVVGRLTSSDVPPDAPRRRDGTIDLDQLMQSQPSTPQQGLAAVDARDRHAAAIPLREVPVINRVAAGRPSEYTDLDYPAGVADDYVPVPDLPDVPVRYAFALRVTGDSMAPLYAEGDILIVGPGEARDGDDCVVRLAEEASFATTFKRLYFLREGGAEDGSPYAVRLVPLNPQHAERVVQMEVVSGIYPLLYKMTPARREAVAP